MIRFDPVVAVALGDVRRGRDQIVQLPQYARSPPPASSNATAPARLRLGLVGFPDCGQGEGEAGAERGVGSAGSASSAA